MEMVITLFRPNCLTMVGRKKLEPVIGGDSAAPHAHGPLLQFAYHSRRRFGHPLALFWTPIIRLSDVR